MLFRSAPYGSALMPPSKPQADGVLVKALVRAWRWQKLLDQGVYGSGTAIPAAERSYVSRILRLALLAPNIVESALSGEFGDRLCLNLVEQPRPPLWDAKRRLLLGPRPIRTEALRRAQWFRCDQGLLRDAFWAASTQPRTCAVEIGRRSFSFAARSSGSAAARSSNRVIPSERGLSCRTGPMPLIAVRSSGAISPCGATRGALACSAERRGLASPMSGAAPSGHAACRSTLGENDLVAGASRLRRA